MKIYIYLFISKNKLFSCGVMSGTYCIPEKYEKYSSIFVAFTKFYLGLVEESITGMRVESE